ncbi:hypothetical protein TRVL_00002 [Trypanosoma vivax]|nr:hypothetical protein TRVL_00002 [Trypanosoma vivax]
MTMPTVASLMMEISRQVHKDRQACNKFDVDSFLARCLARSKEVFRRDTVQHDQAHMDHHKASVVRYCPCVSLHCVGEYERSCRRLMLLLLLLLLLLLVCFMLKERSTDTLLVEGHFSVCGELNSIAKVRRRTNGRECAE